jgi:hypothetical protein
MPYIKQEDRPVMDVVVNSMIAQNVKANGDLNYVLFTFCKHYIPKSYNSYKNFCGELRQCATEIERRILAPYEDVKIEENGDC